MSTPAADLAVRTTDIEVLNALMQLAWHGISTSITVVGTHDARVVAMVVRTGHIYNLDHDPDRKLLADWAEAVRTRRAGDALPQPPE